MNKTNTFITRAIALTLALCAAPIAAFAEPSATTLAAPSQADKPDSKLVAADVASDVAINSLIAVERPNFAKEVIGSNRPTFILVTDWSAAKSTTTEKIVNEIAARYPGVKFIHYDAYDIRVGVEHVPAIATWLPGFDHAVTVRHNVQSFDGGEAFLIEQRVKALIEISALRNTRLKLQAEVTAMRELLEDFFDPLGAQSASRNSISRNIDDLIEKLGEAVTAYQVRLDLERDASDARY